LNLRSLQRNAVVQALQERAQEPAELGPDRLAGPTGNVSLSAGPEGIRPVASADRERKRVSERGRIVRLHEDRVVRIQEIPRGGIVRRDYRVACCHVLSKLAGDVVAGVWEVLDRVIGDQYVGSLLIEACLLGLAEQPGQADVLDPALPQLLGEPADHRRLAAGEEEQVLGHALRRCQQIAELSHAEVELAGIGDHRSRLVQAEPAPGVLLRAARSELDPFARNGVAGYESPRAR
jgi:hypothetical protein